MNNFQIIDAKERLAALDINKSFCVQAPAGSGKTELLTQRILTLLAQCNNPEEVLAFTFTRKAAAEMRNRLLQSLILANSTSPEDATKLAPHARLTYDLATKVLKQNGLKKWHLLENTQRIRITTIDSFNAYLTNQLPILSEFGAQPEISTDMQPFFEQAVQACLTYLDDETEISGHISTLLQHLDNNFQTVQRLLSSLLYTRDHWLSLIIAIRDDPNGAKNILSANLNQITEDFLLESITRLKPFQSQILRLAKFASSNIDTNSDDPFLSFATREELPLASESEIEVWITLANFFLTTNDSFRKSVTIKNGFPAPSSASNKIEKEFFKSQKFAFSELISDFHENPEILECLITIRHLPKNVYQKELWQVLSALTQILPFLVAHLDMILKNNSKADYVKMSSAALLSLGDENSPTDLAMRLDYKISHILVDEFQDTSSLQSKLIEKLTWGWQKGDGRSLFIVGDGMQSCYGFRNANVGLFLSARDNGIGNVHLEPLQLKVNFRSEKAVVGWVNQIFKQSFPAKDDISRGAVTYSKSTSIKETSKLSGVEALLWASNTESDTPVSSKDLKIIEANAIISQVKDLIDTFPNSSIAILVRTRSHLTDIIPALRKSAIKWNAKDIDALTSYSEISDLLILTKANLNLADTTAWLAFLRTPFVGLLLADIHQIAHKANSLSQTIWQILKDFNLHCTLSKDAILRLQRIVPILILIRNQRRLQKSRIWIEAIWLALGGPATLNDVNQFSNVETFFLNLEEAFNQGDIININDFEETLEKIKVTERHDPDINLHIMTIHNAKGLEFDYVLIPGLERLTRSNTSPLLIWKEHFNAQGDKKLLLSLLNKKGQDLDPSYQYLKYEEKASEKMENTRLLYIAITRAISKAYIYAHVKCNKGNLKSPPESSLLATIWPALNDASHHNALNVIDIDDELNNVNIEGSGKISTLNNLVLSRLSNDWKNPFTEHLENINQEPDITIEKDNNLPHHHLLEKKMGDIIHLCLKIKVDKDIDIHTEDSQLLLQKNWLRELSSVCHNQDSLNEAIAQIKTNIDNCLTHPRASWLFNSQHTDSQCELALSDYRQSFRREYIIDRTFIDDEGIRWIIDYKSSQISANQTQEEFLIKQSNLYSPQLNNYAALFKAMEERPIQLALFFTSIPYLLVLT